MQVINAAAPARSACAAHPAERLRARVLTLVFTLFGLAPAFAYGCACGCGVFDIGTASLFPSGSGGIAYLEYDAMNQNRNWHGTSSTPPAGNTDKQIRTQFYTLGVNYMFNREWGVMVKLPYWNRDFTTDPGGGNVAQFNGKSWGDVRLEGMYTGFSPDMSTGVTFGVKLPTGDYTNPNFDRDVQIGTGSTDLLLGAYHLGALDEGGYANWFVQGHYEHAIATRSATDPSTGVGADYRPGDEVDAALGVAYSLGALGPFSNVALVGQLKGTVRARDTGTGADNFNTGYTRALAGPGIEATAGPVRLYADVTTPVYQRVNGDQLVPRLLFKVIAGYSF